MEIQEELPTYSTKGTQALPPCLPPEHTLVQFQHVHMHVNKCRDTVKAIFSSNRSVSSLTNIIGSYLDAKTTKQLQRTSAGLGGPYKRSKPEIQLYNHIMHKLETLSSKVVSDPHIVRSDWETAWAPFRRQTFADLYNKNDIVRCFAKEFPDGPLTLPKLDDYALGIKSGRYWFHAPVVPIPKGSALSVLSNVRTVILLDDSSSMTLPGHTEWNAFTHGDASEFRWDQALRVLAGVAPKISQYNPYGIDLHFLNRPTFYTGLRTDAEVLEAFNAGNPNYTSSTGQRVNDILDGYISTLRYYRDLMPLNLLVITDGQADDRALLSWAIDEHITKIIERGYQANQLGVEFVQVGDSPYFTDDLLALEEEVNSSHQRNVVGVTPITRISNLTPELLLRISVSGIHTRINGYRRG